MLHALTLGVRNVDNNNSNTNTIVTAAAAATIPPPSHTTLKSKITGTSQKMGTWALTD